MKLVAFFNPKFEEGKVLLKLHLMYDDGFMKLDVQSQIGFTLISISI